MKKGLFCKIGISISLIFNILIIIWLFYSGTIQNAGYQFLERFKESKNLARVGYIDSLEQYVSFSAFEQVHFIDGI